MADPRLPPYGSSSSDALSADLLSVGAVLGASYCECFSSSRYCEGCKCTNCENTAEHEDARQKAIASILERSPNAFKPKVNHKGFGSHTKGCNCKKVLRRRGLGPTAPARCRHCHSHRASAECVTLRADVLGTPETNRSRLAIVRGPRGRRLRPAADCWPLRTWIAECSRVARRSIASASRTASLAAGIASVSTARTSPTSVTRQCIDCSYS